MTSPTKLCMIIRNISVVLVIYDYFSVVVCQCQLHQISVPSCPRSPHEWSLKAKEICTKKDKYHCLITENHNEDIPDLIECCMPYKNISRGHMPRYNTLKKTIQKIACDNGYYMTTTFASNRYRSNGVEHCNDKKSACGMEGMKIYDNGSTTEDRKCYCDYKNNFKPDLPLDPNVVYFYEKDNHCSMSECELEFQEMNMMYQCVNVCKDGEYRPERSMDCIPKSSTTIPPVVVSINGSTAGVVIKTTLQTTTKSTPENSFEQTETTEDKFPVLAVVAVVLAGAAFLAIFVYIGIKKTSTDGNKIHCCVYFRKTINIHAQTVSSGDGSKIHVNYSPSNPEKDPLMEGAANNMTAGISNVGGDEKNITVKNTSEDKKEKANTSVGSSSSSSPENSSSSSSPENASSSENETSSNIDKTEQGTQNSDCGQETGDVDKKSKLKPVSVTEQKNICVSDIERIAGEHGFSVKNVRGDGNCMFHAIALQLLGNKLNNKIGEEKSKELRCKIVEFLKNNDTTPTGEKYSSFLSSVHENEGENRWSKYLESMSKPGNYGDEIILRAVSHCFNVRIHVLSTASPERFIKYNSPDISEDSVYLGFIDESLHYVRLQPISSGNQRPYTSMNESSV